MKGMGNEGKERKGKDKEKLKEGEAVRELRGGVVEGRRAGE